MASNNVSSVSLTTIYEDIFGKHDLECTKTSQQKKDVLIRYFDTKSPDSLKYCLKYQSYEKKAVVLKAKRDQLQVIVNQLKQIVEDIQPKLLNVERLSDAESYDFNIGFTTNLYDIQKT
jgi:hypothetical protein